MAWLGDRKGQAIVITIKIELLYFFVLIFCFESMKIEELFWPSFWGWSFFLRLIFGYFVVYWSESAGSVTSLTKTESVGDGTGKNDLIDLLVLVVLQSPRDDTIKLCLHLIASSMWEKVIVFWWWCLFLLDKVSESVGNGRKLEDVIIIFFVVGLVFPFLWVFDLVYRVDPLIELFAYLLHNKACIKPSNKHIAWKRVRKGKISQKYKNHN